MDRWLWAAWVIFLETVEDMRIHYTDYLLVYMFEISCNKMLK